ncbi:MAG: hypothetical protein JWO06_1187 [Bacteroidota bacterium]|nr:hypothetical protein [Bacteroidota bacterium]
MKTTLKIKLSLIKLASSFEEVKTFKDFAITYQKLEKLVLFN